jgi:AcrR family transcriptional regulator
VEGNVNGLRERKKEAARQALHEAAFRLISEHGPENVTIEAIAEAASLSRRTFSNYFPSKEAALYYREDLRTQQLLDLVRNRPDDESALTALRQALITIAKTSALDAEQLEQRRLLRSRPSFTAYRAASHLATERGLTTELLKRLPPGSPGRLSAQMLAATGLAALRVATSYWLENQDQQLHELVSEALEHVRE